MNRNIQSSTEQQSDKEPLKTRFPLLHAWWSETLAPSCTLREFSKQLKAWGLSLEDDPRLDKLRKRLLEDPEGSGSADSITENELLDFKMFMQVVSEAGVSSLLNTAISGNLSKATCFIYIY